VTPTTRQFLIALGYASDAERAAVQAIVKAHANGWWHNLPDVWIAGGHEHAYWADLIKPVLGASNAQVVVLELPRDQAYRMFALRGPHPASSARWLWNSYHGKPRPGQVE